MASSSSEFAKDSVLDFLIPEASEVDIEDALRSSEAAREIDDTALITSITQRTLLFFGTQCCFCADIQSLTHR